MFNVIKQAYRVYLLKRDEADYRREKGRKAVVSYPPRWITVGITNKCNNRCVFCAYHCEDAKNNSNVYNIPFTMGYADFTRIVDMAYAGRIPYVHICATGEPFLHKDILKILDYTIKVYRRVSTQTNFFRPIFERFGYLDEILKRKEHIAFITTDILSGNPEQHNALKKGSDYNDVMGALEYLSAHSNIKFHINLVLTKLNYNTIPRLINNIAQRKINAQLNIFNLYSYDFNEFTLSDMVYTSQDKEITEVLQRSKELGCSVGVKVSIPSPADKTMSGCDIFWEKIQIWPVLGNNPARYHENLIPHACRAVVKGDLNSLGYIFDYKTVMEFWNNDKIVQIRRNLMAGLYPSVECKYCFLYNNACAINKTRKSWLASARNNLQKFERTRMYMDLNENSICIDCGANVGSVVELFVKKGAMVHAFEPHPMAFEVLKNKFSGNKRVILYPLAVSDRDATAKLFMYKLNSEDPVFWSQGASVYAAKADIDRKDYIEVKVINLINFIKVLGKTVDILKMDVEGCEYDILTGIIEAGLHKKIKHILVETHDRHIPEIVQQGVRVRTMIEQLKITNIQLDWV